MPSTFGQWLIVVLALGLGLAAGWVLRGRQDAPAATGGSTMEGDPVGGAAVVATPAAPATIDADRPEATVDPAPAASAVLDEPAPADGGPTPAGAVLGGHDPAPADAAEVEPAQADAEPAVTYTEPEPGRPTAGDVPVPAPVGTPAIPAPRSSTENAAATAEPAADEPTTGRDDEATATAPDPAPAVQPGDVTGTAAAVPVAGAEAADDFRRIQGIGPKMAAALQDAGIRSYRQLAELDEAALRDTVRAAGLRAAASLATWPQQAKLLAGAAGETDRALPSTVGTGEDA